MFMILHSLETLQKLGPLATVVLGQIAILTALVTVALLEMVALIQRVGQLLMVELTQAMATVDPIVILDHLATLGQAMEMLLEILPGVVVVDHLEPLVMETQVVTLEAVAIQAHLATLVVLALVDQKNRIRKRKQVRRLRSMVRQADNL